MTVTDAFRIFPAPLRNFLTTITIVMITPDVITLLQHHHSDNKQPYNNVIKLPDGRFQMIRFFHHSDISGSVARTGNKQSAVFRCAAADYPEPEVTQHMGFVSPGERQPPQDMACSGRWATRALVQIRNWLFSDLSGKKEKVYVLSYCMY